MAAQPQFSKTEKDCSPLQSSGLHGIPSGVCRRAADLLPGPADSKMLPEVAGKSTLLQCFLSEMLVIHLAMETEVGGLGEIAVSSV